MGVSTVGVWRLGFFGSRTLAAVASYLVFPLDLWMLGLGIMILGLRPDDPDARVSALTLVYWAAGHLLCDVPGMGALLAPLPVAARAALYLIDDFFLAGFFGACMNFAMTFPRSRVSGPLCPRNGMTRGDAYLWLGQVLEARCTQFVNPTFTYLVKVARAYWPGS